MSEQKIFAGPRVRRIRNNAGLTQTAMAAELGISPSYLNLIERNQRPLTVQLLLKLASVYKIDLEELQAGGDSMLPQLKEMFADPLLVGELPGDQELVEVSDAAPNVATAMQVLNAVPAVCDAPPGFATSATLPLIRSAAGFRTARSAQP